MLHYSISQMAEMADLDGKLRNLRLRQIRAGLAGTGSATRTSELDQEAESLLQQVTATYRSQAWKKLFPPPAEEEPNPVVAEILASSRECSLRSLLMLHQLITELPVVGCPDCPRPDESSVVVSQDPKLGERRPDVGGGA